MNTVKYSIRKLFQEGGATRRIGRRSNPDVPLEGAYVPVQLPGESKARVALIEDVFSDSPAFFTVMVKSKAFGIVPGTAVYNEDDKLVSASVIWADGTPGEVGYQYTDANGSYVFSASKTTGSAAAKTAKEIVTKDGSGRDTGVIIGEERGGAAVTLVAQPLPFTAKQNDPVSQTENTGLQMLTFSDLTAKVQIISEAYFEVSADGAAWNFFAEVDPLISNNFYVRIKDTSILGDLTGKLHFQVDGALAGECILTGHVGDGTETYPFPVANPYQLNSCASAPSAQYLQYADIDMDGKDEWEPIGTTETPFTGVYDGDGHTISNLKRDVSEPGSQSSLFGVIDGATIKNLNMDNVHMTADRYAGGICSCVDFSSTLSATIENVRVSGFCSGTYVGGLAGYLSAAHISNCMVDVNLTGGFVGGLIGNSTPNHGAGEVSISECSARGSVEGSKYAGGLIGDAVETTYLSISDSYSHAEVRSSVPPEANAYMAGLVGYFANITQEAGNLRLTRCYCAGQIHPISGATFKAVIHDDLSWAETATISGVFWDKDKSAGVDDGDWGVGYVTEEMKNPATFGEYSEEVWVMNPGEYPILKAEQ